MDGLSFTSNLFHWLAWPVALILIAMLFRTKVDGLIGEISRRLLKARFPGGEIELEPTDAHQLGLAGSGLIFGPPREPAESDGMRDEVIERDEIGNAENPSTVRSETTASPIDIEQITRYQIEVIMDIAARWGWVQAQSGAFKEPPHPVVEWSDTGEPTIMYGTSDATRIRQALERLEPPVAGTAESMRIILEAFADTNSAHGLSRAEASEVAQRAGIDPRGLAGYFRAGLLANDPQRDSRWITAKGRQRLGRLRS